MYSEISWGVLSGRKCCEQDLLIEGSQANDGTSSIRVHAKMPISRVHMGVKECNNKIMKRRSLSDDDIFILNARQTFCDGLLGRSIRSLRGITTCSHSKAHPIPK